MVEALPSLAAADKVLSGIYMGLRVRLRVPCGSRFGKGVPGPLWVGLAFGKESGTCERKIKKVECQKAPKKSSWWTTVQRWVTRCGFFRTDSTFHRFGHHSFAILRRHGESAFGNSMANEILTPSDANGLLPGEQVL